MYQRNTNRKSVQNLYSSIEKQSRDSCGFKCSSILYAKISNYLAKLYWQQLMNSDPRELLDSTAVMTSCIIQSVLDYNATLL